MSPRRERSSDARETTRRARETLERAETVAPERRERVTDE